MRHPSTGPVVNYKHNSTAQRSMGGTTGRRRRPHPNPTLTLNDPRYSTETEYSSKKEIDLDGSKFDTNNGTTALIEMSRNLYHNEVTLSFRSLNLVSRVGHEILETSPPTRQ